MCMTFKEMDAPSSDIKCNIVWDAYYPRNGRLILLIVVSFRYSTGIRCGIYGLSCNRRCIILLSRYTTKRLNS